MLTLNETNIHLKQTAGDKAEGIRLVGQKLVEAGFTSEDYSLGLLAREQIASTFLGNGIAIPHGTPESRDAVKETGVVVLQFPEGVDWGENETVYVAVGIAARSNEHLGILSSLTKVLDNDVLCKQLATIGKPQQFVSAIQGDNTNKPVLSEVLIRCRLSVETALGIKAVSASLLNAAGYINSQGEEKLIQADPVFIGNGIALISTSLAEHTGVSLLVPERPVVINGRDISLLVAIAATNQAHLPIMAELVEWEKQENLERQLVEMAPDDLLKAISGQGWPALKQEIYQRDFVIHNANGLHARPGKVFVSTIKPFDARVEVCNPSKSYDYINGKSLMKLLGLGITKGTHIQVKASGPDAKQALDALEQAIAEGLGE